MGEIDFGNDLLDDIGIVDISNITPGVKGEGEEKGDASPKKEVKDQPAVGKSVASGSDARLLLDSTDGRNALINDLEELANFLIRVRENLVEFQAADFGLAEEKTVKKRLGGLNTESIAPIYHQIMLVR